MCNLRNLLDTNIWMELKYMLIIGFSTETRWNDNLLFCNDNVQRQPTPKICLWGILQEPSACRDLWFHPEDNLTDKAQWDVSIKKKWFSPWSFWKFSVCWKYHKIRPILLCLCGQEIPSPDIISCKSVVSNKTGDNIAAIPRKVHVPCMEAPALTETKKHFYHYYLSCRL